LALLLAALGIYGVLSYSVSRRTNEFGIRMALGAAKRDVLFQVIGEGAALTGLGLALGTGLAILAARLLAGMLFGIRATDPGSFLEVAVIFAGIAILACYLPARHATKIQPIEALRHE
jgi:putative ABC transport system permease protein